MWTQKAPLQVARSHPAAVSYKGKIYVFGGGGPNFLSLDSVEIYDPKSDTWSWGSPMPTHRSGAVAALVNNRIYVIGGGYKKADGKFKFLTTDEIYDPESDRWEKGPDMLQPHDYPGIAVLGDNIYIMGGHHPDATAGGPSKDPGFTFCEVLNAIDGRWVEIAPLPVPRFALKGAFFDEKIIVTGGVAFTGKGLTEYDLIDIYDPVRDAWTREEQFLLPWPAAGHGVCVYKECLYMFGGYSTEGINPRAASYSQATREWKIFPPIDKPRAAMGVVAMEEDIYLIGGWEVDGRTVMDTVITYEPLG